MEGYLDGYASGTVTITKKPVTLTAKNASKPYDGTALTQGGFESDGFVGSEGVTLSMTAASTLTKVGKVDNVIDEGSLVAKAGTELSNYAFTFKKGTLEVTTNETDLVATAKAFNGVYDGQGHNISVSITKKPEGSSPEITYSRSATGTFVTEDKFSLPKNATTSPVTIYAKVALEGYKTVELSQTVSIAKRAITITAGSASRAYNGSALTCKTYTVSPETPTADAGFVSGEGISAVTINSSITKPGSVDNVISGVTFKNGTSKDNYDLTKVNGTLTVTVNETGLAATAAPYEGVYDGKGHVPAVNVTEKPANGNPEIKFSLVQEGPFVPAADFAMPVNAGSAVTVFAEVSLVGYKSALTSSTVTIAKRPVILAAGSASKEYDGKPLTSESFTVKSNPDKTMYPVYGFIGGNGVKSVKMTAASTVTDVGTVANVIDKAKIFGTTGTDLGNYEIICEDGTLEVRNNTTALKLQVPSIETFYDGESVVLAPNVQSPDGTKPTVEYSYSKDGPFVAADKFEAPKDATDGLVKIWVKVSLANYAPVIQQTTVTIKKRTVIIVADSKEFDYDHQPHNCGTWTVKEDPGTYSAYGFVEGEGIESLAMTAASTVTRPPCDEAGCSPVPNVIDETSLVAKDGTVLSNYNILFEKGTLRVKVPADTFLWLRYHDSLILDNWGKPFTGKAYLIDCGVIPSPSNVGVSPDEQALEKAFTTDGLDLEDLPVRPAPSNEKMTLVKTVNIKDGEFIDTPDHVIEVKAPRDHWYKMVFFMDSRTPSGDKTLDMYRGYAGAEFPRDIGYLKFPYQFNYRTTEEIEASTGHPHIGDYNHWAYVGPGKLIESTGDAMLTAKLAWAPNFGYTKGGAWNSGTGTFFARLEVACTNEWVSTLSSVRFVFQDRYVYNIKSGAMTEMGYLAFSRAGVVDRHLPTTESFGGEVFRSLALDVGKIKAQAQGAFYRFGPEKIDENIVSASDTESSGKLLTPEIESQGQNPSIFETNALFTDLPDWQKYCWLVWDTNGRTYSMPVYSATGVSGETVAGGVPVPMKKTLSPTLKKTVGDGYVEVPFDNFNLSVALGFPVVANANPSCRFVEFSATDDAIRGRIVTESGDYEGVPQGEWAIVKLLGTAKIGEEFALVETVTTDADGRFSVKKPAGSSFFKMEVSVGKKYIDVEK